MSDMVSHAQSDAAQRERADEHEIARNIKVHDQVASKYEARHDEIFNDVEQARLAQALRKALGAVLTDSDQIKALDFGCGSGNLTKHLLALGVDVVAADVSPRFLELV